VTDHRGLMEFARAQVAGSGLKLEVIETEARYNTKYERRWSGQGQEIFFELHYRPQGPSSYKQMAEVPVQTLVLDSFNPETVVLEGCQDIATPPHNTGLVIQFRRQVYDPKQEIFMALTTVVEDHLSQTFWIEAARKEGQWHIRPAMGGGFLPTLGVQRALELVQKAGQVG